MRRRLLLLLGLALCGIAQAAPPRIELNAAAAWKGWSRPGRTTEVVLRLASDTATRVSVEVTAGRQSLHTEVDLQPGRVQRLQLPVAAAENLVLELSAPGGAAERRPIAIAMSESPLLGLVLARDEPFELEGFHRLALSADDLPRHAQAYSSIDALVVDAASLAALDAPQLAALLDHAAACGRIVLVNADARVRGLLAGMTGCGGRALLHADALPQARALLETSLATSLPAPISRQAGQGELLRPDHRTWNRVALALAASLAAAALAILFMPGLPALLATSALTAAAVLGLLHGMQPQAQLFVWSEGDSGAQVARYQAWQRFSGVVREHSRVPVPPQLGAAAMACEPGQAMRWEVDAESGRANFAQFDTRLFRQVSLCYSGTFPMERSARAAARAEGLLEVFNAGPKTWPPGLLLLGGRVHDLPALAPGAGASFSAQDGGRSDDGVIRTALARVDDDSAVALWPLELAGVVDAPVQSSGWLVMSVPSR